MLVLDAVGAVEKRVALVIGNNKYAGAALRNPVNDATAMAKKLQDMGFEVMLRTDITQRQMNRAIGEFGDKLSPGSVGLFYYAGHGMQSRGKNYLVPVDAEITGESSVSTESVDVERVLDQLSPARLAMVILDACRNNPFERRFRSGAGRGLAQIDAPAGTLIAYATAPGKVALDGEGQHGTYTEALLRAIERPGLRVEDVFKQVRIDVLRVTSNQQIPWESSSLTGEFAFRPAKTVAAEEPSPRKVEQDVAAAALRDQMAALSAEIAKMREVRAAPSPAPAETNDAERKKAQQEAAALREQLAHMNADIAKLRDNRAPASPNPVQNAQEQKQTNEAAAALGAQIAHLNAEVSRLRTIAPAGTRTPTAEELAEWKRQIAKLEPLRGKLTLATAVLTLLDITDESAIARLRQFEGMVGRRAYNNALALGVDPAGLIVWGGSYRQGNSQFSLETAVHYCQRTSAIKCQVVAVNGSFDEKGWHQVVSRLGVQPVVSVRSAFLATLMEPIVETASGMSAAGSGSTNPSPMGYTFAESAAR